MVIPKPNAGPDVLTYEQYIAEEVIHQRYDIVDGARIHLPQPGWRHQRIQMNAARVFRDYEERLGTGYVISAPFDILIRRLPRLQTRQPDVLFITKSRLEQGGGIPESGPLEVAPELVVEIISDSETEARLEAKLADYVSIGVNEAWVLWPETRTVEVMRLSPDGPLTIAAYGEAQTFCCLTFSDLTVSVAEFFQP